METTEIFSKITPVFQDVLEQDDLVLTNELSADDIENWDSLSHVRLIVSIEQELNIKFDISEVSSAKNVGDMVEQIKQLL